MAKQRFRKPSTTVRFCLSALARDWIYMQDLLLKFGIGVVVLLLSTQTFVKLAKKISLALRISPLIIGITLVALGTTLPELSISLIATIKNDAGLALGNIVGSNIVNILLVLPVGIVIGKLRIGKTKTQRNAVLLLGITGVFVFLQLISFPPLLSGLFLVTSALLITILEYQLAVFGRSHEDSARFINHKRERFSLQGFVSLILSLLGIIIGGILLVTSVEGISLLTGHSTTVLGLSLTAIVTSLPELLTTIFSQKEDQEKIAIGNIIGSNIYNLLFNGGLLTIFSPRMILPAGNWVWLISATSCFVFILGHYKGKTVPRRVGVFLLVLLLIYLLTLA